MSSELSFAERVRLSPFCRVAEDAITTLALRTLTRIENFLFPQVKVRTAEPIFLPRIMGSLPFFCTLTTLRLEDFTLYFGVPKSRTAPLAERFIFVPRLQVMRLRCRLMTDGFTITLKEADFP